MDGVSAKHKLLYVSLRHTNSALICYSKRASENEVLIALCLRNVRGGPEGEPATWPISAFLTFAYSHIQLLLYLFLNLVNIAPIRFIESPTHH
jgi:hypothetical protein